MSSSRKVVFGALALTFALASACSQPDEEKPVGTTPAASEDMAPDAMMNGEDMPSVADMEVDPEGCEPGTGACLYSRAPVTFSKRLQELDYTDITGLTRTLSVAIYEPEASDGPHPVILLSHGGAGGVTSAAGALEEWAGVVASAGYVAVAIAHRGRDEESRARLCEALEFSAQDDCTMFKHLNYDRPLDVAAVLDKLEERAATPQGASVFDMTRVGHLGHSAGAGCGMMLMGATRDFAAGKVLDLSDDRISVAIGFSPQGPGEENFVEESFGHIKGPMMIGTGAGDDTSGSDSEVRRAAFTHMKEGDKALLYLDVEEAPHNLYGHNIAGCLRALEAEVCERYLSWLDAATLAFFDAHLLEEERAIDYLSSGALEAEGEGALLFEQK